MLSFSIAEIIDQIGEVFLFTCPVNIVCFLVGIALELANTLRTLEGRKMKYKLSLTTADGELLNTIEIDSDDFKYTHWNADLKTDIEYEIQVHQDNAAPKAERRVRE